MQVEPLSGTGAARLAGHGLTQTLKPSYLVDNGLQLVGLAGCLLASWLYLRRRAATDARPVPGAPQLWMTFAALAIVILSLVPPGFWVLSRAISPSQAQRLFIIVPWPLGLAALALAASDVVPIARRRPLRLSLLACSVAGAATLAASFGAPDHASELLCGVVIAASAVAGVCGLIRRAATVPGASHATWSPRGRSTVVIPLVLGLASVPGFLVNGTHAWASDLRRGLIAPKSASGRSHSLADRLLSPEYADGLQEFHSPVYERLSRLPAGALVLADPLTGYKVMAEAPVYVVSQDQHVTRTHANRLDQRQALLNQFTARSSTGAERLAVVRSTGARFIVLDRKIDPWLEPFVRTDTADFHIMTSNARISLWRVTR
jgi:hypothetical protein